MIALADGTVFEGEGLGKPGISSGELVFSTSMTGYVEALTDPSYKGQNLLFTYPLIGNYGAAAEDRQSGNIQAEGAIVREACESPSGSNPEQTFTGFLEKHASRGVSQVDTRALTEIVREGGAIKSAILVGDYDPSLARKAAKDQPSISQQDLISEVSTSAPYRIGDSGPTLAVIDTGVKDQILRNLREEGYSLIVVPADFSPRRISDYDPHGIFLANGPGDPHQAINPIRVVKRFAGELPIFGICLGAQIIALALGAQTYKLKFGHRGSNHPVKDLRTGKIYITSQNHGFAIDKDSLKGTGLQATQIHANDDTVEAVEHSRYDLFASQYHPEACPGPQDTERLFFQQVSKTLEGCYVQAS